ncbi:unnamed protein product [Polarella glacialis]|uniref:DEK-C domain-containing protein n=1 Tax=Polarella glacialis TaxID=89957 RepID=A0A813GR88_POLGL|nr:unnamed protein product [Polarella glacialis]
MEAALQSDTTQEPAASDVLATEGKDVEVVQENAEEQKNGILDAEAAEACISADNKEEMTCSQEENCFKELFSGGDADEASPTGARLLAEVSSMLEGRDLNDLRLGKARAELEERLGLCAGGLEDRKDEVNELIKAEVQRLSEEAADDCDDDTMLDGPETPKKQRHALRLGGKRRKHDSKPGWTRRLRQRPSDSQEEIQEEEKSQKQPEEAQGSRAEFLKGSGSSTLTMQVGGQTLEIPAKSFASGTCGYYTCARIQVTIDGVPRELQCQLNCAVLGSEKWTD